MKIFPVFPDTQLVIRLYISTSEATRLTLISYVKFWVWCCLKCQVQVKADVSYVGFYFCDCTDFSCRCFPPSVLCTSSAVINLPPFLGGYCSTFLTTEEKHAAPIFLRGIPNIFQLHIYHHECKRFVLSNTLLPLTQPFNVLHGRS